MALNVTIAVIGSGCNTATATPSLAQWDQGQVLKIEGVDLPSAYQVEFSTEYTRNAIPQIGNADGVAIPNVLLQRSAPITAYIVLHEGLNDREREYWITIYITPGTPPETITPDPEEQSVIDETIAALQDGVAAAEAAADRAETASTHYPVIINDYWYVWNVEASAYQNTGIKAEGEDGYSPEVTVTTITGGHRVTITDAEHPQGQVFDVMDGEDGNTNEVEVKDLVKRNSANVLLSFGNFNDNPGGNLGWTWNESHTTCTYSYTGQSPYVVPRIYNGSTSLPDVLTPGETYQFKFSATRGDLYLKVMYYANGTVIGNQAVYGDRAITIPDTCDGLVIEVSTPTWAFQGSITVALVNAPSNAELADEIDTLTEDAESLESAVGDITSTGEYLDLSTVEMTVGSYLKSDGTIGQNDSFLLSDYIELPEGVNTITVNRDVYTSAGEKYPQGIMVFWYDAEKVYKGTGTNTYSDNLLTSAPSAWFNYKYVRVNFSRYKVHNFVRLGYFYDLKYKTHLLTADLNDITDPGVYLIPFTANITNKPNMQNTLAFLTVNLSPFQGHASQVLATNYGQYTRTKVNGVWSSWAHFDDGMLYSYTGTFTTTETLQTDFTMSPNTSYVIKFYGDRTNIINVFGLNNVNVYKRVSPWDEEVTFTNDATARKLAFYNPLGQLDSVNVKVYRMDSVALKAEAVPRVYRVTKSTTGDYTSLSKCLIDLKDDHSPKVIEVWEGDYDIYAEYVELYNAGLLEIYTGNDPAQDYFPYCVWVPENTHIIGKGIVRLKWMPDPAVDDITPVQCQCISPLNVAATATIENIEVHCKNGRYCLHNDGLGKAEFTGAVQKYTNIRFYKYANDVVDGASYGWNHTTGFGIDRAMHHIYENCAFYNSATGRAFYGHSRGTVGGVTLTEAMCSDITLTNCILDSNCGATGVFCKLGNSPNQNLHIPVSFDNCTFGNGWMLLANESTSAQTEYPNAFDLTFNNCGEFKLQINDTNNRYLPKRYDNLLQEIDNMKTDNGIYEKLTNAGEYVISADDLESGQWSWSRKDDNAARGRTKFLIPVYAGMSISYENTTFDVYFGVLETPTSMTYLSGLSGWKTDSSGVFNITADGYLTFVIRNHADTTATVDPADFDSVVTINTAQKNAISQLTPNTNAENVDLDIIDDSGNVLVRLSDGHIATKNFSSSDIVRRVSELEIPKWTGLKWTVIGDSLTEVNSRASKRYYDYISEKTGITVVNKGVSGTGYMSGVNDNRSFIARVATVPTDSDVVTIFGSCNDRMLTLGTVTDTGTTTVCGCINKTLDDLYARMPTVNLGIITPTPIKGNGPSNANSTMSLYSAAIVEICRMRSIPCLDLFHCSGLRPDDPAAEAETFSKDDGNGVHPDENGHAIIATKFKAFLESLIL